MSTTANPVGRPLKFKTVKEMQDKIDSYFDFCDNRTKEIMDRKGNSITILVPAPYTMSGLANTLDISRETLSNYRERDEFLDAITRARSKVQEDIETRLMETRNERGAIFNLTNNFGWKQKQETDITTGGEKITFEWNENKDTVHTTGSSNDSTQQPD